MEGYVVTLLPSSFLLDDGDGGCKSDVSLLLKGSQILSAAGLRRQTQSVLRLLTQLSKEAYVALHIPSWFLLDDGNGGCKSDVQLDSNGSFAAHKDLPGSSLLEFRAAHHGLEQRNR
jgi:hypothetical protein